MRNFLRNFFLFLPPFGVQPKAGAILSSTGRLHGQSASMFLQRGSALELGGGWGAASSAAAVQCPVLTNYISVDDSRAQPARGTESRV